MKAIDWRLRPPFGSFKGCSVYNAAVNDPKFKAPNAAKVFSMESLIEEMDAADIAIGVVPIRQENDNNDIARIKEQYPGRFEGLAHIDPFDTEKAIEDVDRYVVHGVAKGIILEPGQIFLRDSVVPNHKIMLPIYEKCQKEDIMITLTFGGLSGRALKYYCLLYTSDAADE